MEANEDGSAPLANEADENFARLVALEGLSFQDAFIESRPGPRRQKSDSTRVLASRLAKKTEARRLYLARRAADKRPAVVRTDRQSILLLMDRVTTSMRRAAELAAKHGDSKLANSLRASLTVHVGRHSRVSQRLERPAPASDPEDDEVYVMARRILEMKDEC